MAVYTLCPECAEKMRKVEGLSKFRCPRCGMEVVASSDEPEALDEPDTPRKGKKKKKGEGDVWGSDIYESRKKKKEKSDQPSESTSKPNVKMIVGVSLALMLVVIVGTYLVVSAVSPDEDTPVAAEDWHPITMAGWFSAEVPGSATNKELSGNQMKIVLQWSEEPHRYTFAVGHVEGIPKERFEKDKEQVVEDVIAVVVGSFRTDKVDVREMPRKTIQLGGFPGREVTAEISIPKGFEMKARFYYTARHIYVILAVGKSFASEDNPSAKHFFDAFKIMEPLDPLKPREKKPTAKPSSPQDPGAKIAPPVPLEKSNPEPGVRKRSPKPAPERVATEPGPKKEAKSDEPGVHVVKVTPDAHIQVGKPEELASIQRISYSQDGKTLVVVGTNGQASWYVSQTRQVQGPIGTAGKGSAVVGAEISSDGGSVVTSWKDGYSNLVNREDASRNVTISSPGSASHPRLFSPDGKLLWVDCGDKPCQIWDVATGMLSGPAPVPSLGRAAAFSSDGKLLAVQGREEMEFYNAANGNEVSSQPIESKHMHTLFFSPNGKLLAGSSAEGVSLWKLKPLQDGGVDVDESTSMRKGRRTGPICFTPDGTKLLCGVDAEEVQVWDVQSEKCLARLKIAAMGQVAGLTFRPDGKELAVAGKSTVYMVDWKAIKLEEEVP